MSNGGFNGSRLQKSGDDYVEAQIYVNAVTTTVKFGLIVAMLASLGFAILGVIVVYIAGDEALSNIKIFGQSIETSSIGVAIIACSIICFVLSLRSLTAVVRDMVKRNGKEGR